MAEKLKKGDKVVISGVVLEAYKALGDKPMVHVEIDDVVITLEEKYVKKDKAV